MDRPEGIIIAGSGSVAIDRALLRSVRGSPFKFADPRFVIIALLSIGIHAGIMLYLDSIKLAAPKVKTIEQIPERFAKLIIEKPLPKEEKKKTADDAAPEKPAEKIEKEKIAGSETPTVASAAAKKSVEKTVAAVEQKIRTVGVLGMLTGTGTTAKGPSVVDVLGAAGERKERLQDLDKALADVGGLVQTQSIDVVQRKLVKSKDVEITRKESIDDLIAGIGSAKTADIAKRGDILISRPESIEGAGSSNAKRDIAAINAIVASHKMSVRMSYEKYLKRSPDLAGKITVRFTIDAGGGVSRVDVLENTTGNNELEEELVRKIRMWKFDAVPEGDVTVTYPLVFQPAA